MGIQNVLGVNYPYPDVNDKPWGEEHIDWATAVSEATNTLQTEVNVLQTTLATKVETSSDAGSGVGLTLPKSGTDLPFKSLVAGPTITIVDNGDDITINTNAGGGNVVGPASSIDEHIAVFDGTLGNKLKDGGYTIADILAAASGTVTTVSVVTANGISGTVANPTTTPAITLILGAITPTSVNSSGTLTGSNLSGTNTGDQTITLTSDVTGSGTGSFATTIANDAVTFAKFQNITSNKLLGRATAFSGDMEEITLGTGLSFTGTTLNVSGFGTGTVTSVAVSGSNGIGVSGSPITSSGTIALSLGAITPTSIAASGTVTGSNLSGTNTGDQTITLTGDISGTGTGSFATTLATVNSNVGAFGSATQVATFTVNAKGLTTAAGNVTITPAASSITGGAALTKTDDTNVTLTLGGTPTTALLTASSLTLGWTGTLSGARGGTGVNNGSSTITVSGNLTHAGAFTQTFTATANTSLTLPTTGTLATLAGTETFTNKTIGVTQLNGSAYTMAVNNTGSTANYTEVTYKRVSEATYSGTVSWTATTAPSGTVTNTYAWTQYGKDVSVYFWLKYTVAGTAVTLALLDFPGDLPLPAEPTNFTGTNDVMYTGSGGLSTSTTNGIANNSSSSIVKTGSSTYRFSIKSASNSTRVAFMQLNYRST